MSELRSIHLAIELATRQRDVLAKNHAQAIRNMDFAKSQMGQLQNYALDTDGRWTGATGTLLSAELIRHHYQFMDRLQQAIGMQEGVMANLSKQLETAHQALLQAEFRLAGLNQVLKTRQSAIELTQKRREQRQTDEFAAQRHLRARSAQMRGEHHDY
jgi:flagellar FliJ protein